MSKHVWLCKRWGERVLEIARRAYHLARIKAATDSTITYEEAFRFTGYVVESFRQKGGGIDYGRHSRLFVADCLWEASAARGFLYRRGINRDNYELAGRRMVLFLLRRCLPANLPLDVMATYVAVYDGVDTAVALGHLLDLLETNEYTDALNLLTKGVEPDAPTAASQDDTDYKYSPET